MIIYINITHFKKRKLKLNGDIYPRLKTGPKSEMAVGNVKKIRKKIDDQ